MRVWERARQTCGSSAEVVRINEIGAWVQALSAVVPASAGRDHAVIARKGFADLAHVLRSSGSSEGTTPTLN